MQLQHKTPKISEVNLEIKDYKFYFKEDLSTKNLTIDFAVKTSFAPPNNIAFFVHLKYELEEDKFTLYHTDYLSLIEIIDVNWNDEKKIKIETNFLASLLGRSIVMIRGAISLRLANNILSDYPLPVINPSELIKKQYESKGKFTFLDPMEVHFKH